MECRSCHQASSRGDPLRRCSACKIPDAVYCSPSCQSTDWASHKSACKASRSQQERIEAVELGSGPQVRFSPTDVKITPSHPVFRLGQVAPVSKLIGVPLLVWRHMSDDPSQYLFHPHREQYDNQGATYLMINPDDGFAPPAWQQGIGKVTVARKDKKPLNKLELEMVVEYFSEILDHFGDGYTPRGMYSKEAFRKWCVKYKDFAMENGRESFKNARLPL